MIRALKSLLGLLLVIPPMLVGWGLDDLSGFFANPARTSLFIFSFAYVVATPLCLKESSFGKRSPVAPSQCWPVLISQAAILILRWLLPHGDRQNLLTFADTYLPRAVGVVLFIIGGAVQLWAMRTLERQYSPFITLQNNHQLVQTGIYRVIRHPIYLGLLLGLSGLVLAFRSWLVVPAFLLATLFIATRMRQEEKLLCEQFGPEFDAYRKRTKRLVPYLY